MGEATVTAAAGTDPTVADPTAAKGLVREAVGIFDSEEALTRAVDDLAMAGFAQHELSLMANDEVARRRLGFVPDHVDQAKDNPAAPRQSYVAPEEVGNAQGAAIGIPAYVGAIIGAGAVVASGGTALVAALAAALAGGAGGGLGAVLARWVGQSRQSLLDQHLAKGGILLWVNLRDGERERLAREILARHTSHPVEVHDIPQAGSEVPMR
jgi:hypothetical protein